MDNFNTSRSKKINKKYYCEPKRSYIKIPNKLREKLLQKTLVENEKIIDAAKELKINYSTAKAIVYIYKKQQQVQEEEPKNLQRCIFKEIGNSLPNPIEIISSNGGQLVQQINTYRNQLYNYFNNKVTELKNYYEEIPFLGQIKEEFFSLFKSYISPNVMPSQY